MARNKEHKPADAPPLKPVTGGTNNQGTPLPPLVPQGITIQTRPIRAKRARHESDAIEEGQEEKPAEPVRRYRVTADARISHPETGLPATMRAGKIVDSRSHNIEHLKAMSVQMVEITDEET